MKYAVNYDFRKELIFIKAKRRILTFFWAVCIVTMQILPVSAADESEVIGVADITAEVVDTEEGLGVELFSAARENIYAPNTIPDYWELGYKNENKIDKAENYIQVSSAYSYSGVNSVEFSYPMGDQGDGTAIYFRNYSVGGLEAANYELSFVIMESSRTPLCIKLESEGGKTVSKELKWPLGVKREDAGDGWWKYTVTFKPSDINTQIKQIYFEQFDRIEDPVYLDDITLTRVDETENLIKNGSFEAVYIPSEIDKYEPSNVIVSVRNKVILTPSWVNPQTTAEAVRLYDITDGKNLLLSDEFETGAGKINHYKYSELTPNKEYMFRIEFDFGNDFIKEFYTYGSTATEQTALQAGGWATEFMYGSEHGYTPVWVGMDTSESHSGKSSLRIKSNINGENGLMLELNIAFGNKFTENKRYKVSYWAKGNKVSANALDLRMENTDIFSLNTVGEDWEEYSGIYDTTITATSSPSVSGCLKFWVMKPIGDLWIDDIEVYELDENLNEIGENLVSDAEVSGFEKDTDVSMPPPVKQLSAQATSRKVSLIWTNPVSSVVDHINVYEVIDDEYALRAVLPATKSELQLSNLINSKEYKYAVKTVSKFNVESDAVEVSAAPATPETEILDLKLNGGVDKLSVGSNTFEVKALNNFAEEAFEVELIVGVFKNDGKEMVELVTSPATLNTGESKLLSASVNIPAQGDGYAVKVFIWNKLFGLDSHLRVSEFKVE